VIAFPSRRQPKTGGGAMTWCFKIGGKIFLTLGLDHRRMSFKCVPEKFAEFVEQEHIRPAPYVGRQSAGRLARWRIAGVDPTVI